MREFYRWEHDLPLGAPPPREDLGRWITEREALWEGLAAAEFGPLPLAEGEQDAFAVAAMNRALVPAGLIYGAGIGRFHKPHFFLGRLERAEDLDGLQVLVSGCEYARDLTAIPAALQGGTVIVRREALGQWIWEKAEAWGMKKKPGAMARALAAQGYEDDPAAALARMTEAEIETVILHERGEQQAGKRLEPAWGAMVAGFGQKRPELLARAVRDHLADCLTTLPVLLAQDRQGSLHFWFANLDGLRRDLFPSLARAYEDWAAGRGSAGLEATLTAGRAHWQAVAERLLASHTRQGAAAETELAAWASAPVVLAL